MARFSFEAGEPFVRVVAVVDTAPPQYGGAGEQALLLAKTLEAGTKAQFSILSRKKQDLVPQDSMVRFIGPYLRNQQLSNLFFALLSGWHVLRSNADIIHVHGAYYYGFTSVLAAKLSRKSSVLKITLLGGDDPESIRALRILGLPVGRLLVKQFRWADVVIALNEDIHRAVLAFDARINVAVMHNGVTLSNEHAFVDQAKPTVLFAGNVGIRKGADTLIRAWPIVLESVPEAELVLAGPISLDVEAHMSTIEVDAAKSIEFLGPVPRSEVADWMTTSAVFVLPSRAEGLPNALIEALAAGMPVVASGIPVNRSTAGQAAVYCDEDSPESVASAIVEALRSRECLSRKSRDAAKRFDIVEVASFYSSIYDRLLGAKSSRWANRARV